MIKKILSNPKLIRILIFLITAIIFVVIFIISEGNIDKKSDSLNIERTYINENYLKGNLLIEKQFLDEI